MKTKILALIIAIVLLLALASCGKSNETPQITAPSGNSSGNPLDAHKDKYHNFVDGSEQFADVNYPAAPEKYDGIYERGYNFSVFYTEANKKPYLIQLFKDSGEMIETIETVNPPMIREGVGTDSTVVAVSTSEDEAGTYKVTFYDITNDKKSEARGNFISAEYGYAVFVNASGFIIRDMFDDGVFYKELPVDTKGFDTADRTKMSAQFSPNGKNIVVSYSVGGVDYDTPFKLK